MANYPLSGIGIFAELTGDAFVHEKVARNTLNLNADPIYVHELRKFEAIPSNGLWESGTFLKLLDRDLGPCRLEKVPNSHRRVLFFCLNLLYLIVYQSVGCDRNKPFGEYQELEEMVKHLLILIPMRSLQLSGCLPWRRIFFAWECDYCDSYPRQLGRRECVVRFV